MTDIQDTKVPAFDKDGKPIVVETIVQVQTGEDAVDPQ